MEISQIGISHNQINRNIQTLIKRYPKSGKVYKLKFYLQLLAHQIDDTPRLRPFSV